jgi:transcriptional regulator with XRE-family HTH domain
MESINNETKEESFGARVRKIREALHLLQTDFAAKINMHSSYLSEIETGTRKVGQKIILKIAVAYNVNLNWLLMGKGPMFIEADDPQVNLKWQDFGDQAQDMKELFEYCTKSKLVRLHVTAYTKKFLLKYEELIKKDINKNKSLIKEKTHDNDE